MQVTIPTLYWLNLSINEKISERKTEGQPMYIVAGLFAPLSGDR
jgi:hypothetical protein